MAATAAALLHATGGLLAALLISSWVVVDADRRAVALASAIRRRQHRKRSGGVWVLRLLLAHHDPSGERQMRWIIPDDLEVPPSLLCPITHELLYDPVSVFGMVCERDAVEEWVIR